MAATPTNWARLKEIVADAIDAPTAERDAMLLTACADDAELVDEARKLIAAYDEVDGVVLNRDTDGWLGVGGPDVLSLGGQRIGRYRLERVLGEGAMSAVYLARQANPDRPVALKLLRTAIPLVDARQRFRREATALARLQHPNIAVIYEAGLHDTSDSRAIPFIAMEFVDGVPLTDYATERKLDRKGQIELLIVIARAVQHAHQQTIVHRDLKPANVLVDTSGTPKVLDFGIARIAAVDADRATWQTTAGLLLGTPGYMSPEQCSSDSDGVDVRSDVWSLGVMLYELLLGRLPIAAKGGSITEVMRRLETAEPTPPHMIDPSVRGDLATILMTAVCRDKNRRYASAQAFADDLGRYLKQLPIEAHPPTTFYLASKFVRRHRGVIAAACVAAAALMASTLVSSAGFYNASRERDRAVASEQRAIASERRAIGSEKRATAVRDFLSEIIGSPDPMTGKRDVTVLDMLRQNERLLETKFANDPGTAAELFSTVGWTYFNLSEYDAAERNLRKAIDYATIADGATASTTLDARCRLVTVLRWKDAPADAKKICDLALADALRTLGPEHASTYALLDNDAGISEDLGDHATAITKYEKLYVLGKRIFGPKDPQTLTAGNNLGLSLLEADRNNDAERVLREVVNVYDSRTGNPNSMQGLIPRHNLATVLSNLERVADAIVLQKQVVAISEAILPESHRDLRNAWLSLAEMFRQNGQYEEAMAYAKRAEAASSKTDGRSHPTTIRALDAEMAIFCESGRLAEGVALGRATLANCIIDGTGDDRAAWDLRTNLAAALNDANDPESAVRDGAACLAYRQRADGPNASTTLTVACNYAGALVNLNRLDEADHLIRQSLADSSEEQLLLRASLHRMLGKTMIAGGRYDEAKNELDTAWAYVNTLPSPHHRRRVVDQYISLYTKTGNAAEAERWRAVLASLAPARAIVQPATQP